MKILVANSWEKVGSGRMTKEQSSIAILTAFQPAIRYQRLGEIMSKPFHRDALGGFMITPETPWNDERTISAIVDAVIRLEDMMPSDTDPSSGQPAPSLAWPTLLTVPTFPVIAGTAAADTVPFRDKVFSKGSSLQRAFHAAGGKMLPVEVEIALHTCRITLDRAEEPDQLPLRSGSSTSVPFFDTSAAGRVERFIVGSSEEVFSLLSSDNGSDRVRAAEDYGATASYQTIHRLQPDDASETAPEDGDLPESASAEEKEWNEPGVKTSQDRDSFGLIERSFVHVDKTPPRLYRDTIVRVLSRGDSAARLASINCGRTTFKSKRSRTAQGLDLAGAACGIAATHAINKRWKSLFGAPPRTFDDRYLIAFAKAASMGVLETRTLIEQSRQMLKDAQSKTGAAIPCQGELGPNAWVWRAQVALGDLDIALMDAILTTIVDMKQSDNAYSVEMMKMFLDGMTAAVGGSERTRRYFENVVHGPIFAKSDREGEVHAAQFGTLEDGIDDTSNRSGVPWTSLAIFTKMRAAMGAALFEASSPGRLLEETEAEERIAVRCARRLGWPTEAKAFQSAFMAGNIKGVTPSCVGDNGVLLWSGSHMSLVEARALEARFLRRPSFTVLARAKSYQGRTPTGRGRSASWKQSYSPSAAKMLTHEVSWGPDPLWEEMVKIDPLLPPSVGYRAFGQEVARNLYPEDEYWQEMHEIIDSSFVPHWGDRFRSRVMRHYIRPPIHSRMNMFDVIAIMTEGEILRWHPDAEDLVSPWVQHMYSLNVPRRFTSVAWRTLVK